MPSRNRQPNRPPIPPPGPHGPVSAPTPTSVPTTTVTSSFLLGNLHCPTCVSSIKDAIYGAFPSGGVQLSPSGLADGHDTSSPIIYWVSPNVVTSVVTVEHRRGASLRRMRQALEDRGFEVCAVATTDEEASDLHLDLDLDLSLGLDGAGDTRGQLGADQPASSTSGTSQRQTATTTMARSTTTSSFARWFKPLRSSAAQNRRRQQTHLEHCEQCRVAAANGGGALPVVEGVQQYQEMDDEKPHVETTTESATPTTPTAPSPPAPARKEVDVCKPLPPLPQPQPQHQEPFISISPAHPPPQSLFRATLAIGGMTCASCAQSIRSGLQQKPWIASVVSVDAITGSAVVELHSDDKADELVRAVEEMGFEASLVEVVPVGSCVAGEDDGFKEEKGTEEEEVWRASLAVVGMTCASCANSITREVGKRGWVRDVKVNLLTHSATVDFEGRKERAKDVVDAIEELGFEATLSAVEQLNATPKQPGTATEGDNPQQQQERTIDILIKGLYCPSCPSRILSSLAGFQPHHRLRVLSPPTLARPILKLAYLPQPPAFTVRQILAAISASDPNLTASLYHPPTLEERAKQIQRQHRRAVLWRVVFAGVVSIPTLIIGIVYMSLVPKHSPSAHYLMAPWTSGISRAQVALFVLATPVYFFAADLFHRRAIKEIRALWRRGSQVPVLQRFYRFGSMNTLMSLGTTIAYVSSVSQMIAAAVHGPEEVEDSNFYFDSVVFLTFFLLLGRLIESYSKQRTGDAVEALVRLRPSTAVLVGNANSEQQEADQIVQADLLDKGDVIRIPHGASPPADGVVVRGESVFDESSLTGESRPVRKVPGDPVFAGTVNQGAQAVLARVTGSAGASMLDRIVQVVREGQTKRAPIERVADVMTGYFVPAVTLVAVVTWIVWLSLGLAGRIPGHYLDVTSGGWVAFSLQFAIAVFVVACPCGLALAAPTAIFVGSGLAARYGILAKGGGEAFEKASRVDVVVFDKTGTLTVGGEPSVTDAEVYEEDKEVVLAALKGVEENSSHPIAKAVVAYCAGKTKAKVSVDKLKEVPGKGLQATATAAVGGEDKETSSFDLAVGNEAFMADFGVPVPASTASTIQRWKEEAKSIALVAIRRHHRSSSTTATTAGEDDDGEKAGEWTLAAALSISDPIRPEAPRIISSLQSRGIRVWMLSGDNPTTAAAVARQLGIPSDQVIAGVLPTGKAEKIKYLQSTLRAQRTGWFGSSRTQGREGESKRAMVAMVGDGINDSPALTTADVGIAIGSGADVAISSADFVLVKSDLRAVVDLLDLSTVVLRRIAFNFGWAVVYNVLALPVAAGVFYPIVTPSGQHVRLDPVWASLAMALSSISVVMSSLALRVKGWGVGFKQREIE
ncbi:hypothetical protein VTJ04DRAFT_10223 [Mycothermus thermophilus]|uniref:uncharacterized protein n=1 Tax=Humicola insolens TaxID=85995 RepID=UPI003743C1ED